jgi:hypothetical protein
MQCGSSCAIPPEENPTDRRSQAAGEITGMSDLILPAWSVLAGFVQSPARRPTRARIIRLYGDGAFRSPAVVVANLGQSRGLLAGFGAKHGHFCWFGAARRFFGNGGHGRCKNCQCQNRPHCDPLSMKVAICRRIRVARCPDDPVIERSSVAMSCPGSDAA